MELKDPETGKQLVSEVVFPHKKYPGDHVADLPDLVIKWNDDMHIQGMVSQKTGEIFMSEIPDARTGAHKDFGFFLAVGDGIRHVNGEKDNLRQAYSEDIAPTILKYMGFPIPEDMDGKALDDIFDNGEIRK